VCFACLQHLSFFEKFNRGLLDYRLTLLMIRACLLKQLDFRLSESSCYSSILKTCRNSFGYLSPSNKGQTPPKYMVSYLVAVCSIPSTACPSAPTTKKNPTAPNFCPPTSNNLPQNSRRSALHRWQTQRSWNCKAIKDITLVETLIETTFAEVRRITLHYPMWRHINSLQRMFAFQERG